MAEIEPITLTGRFARLEPLRLEHAAELYEASRQEPDLWRYMPVSQPGAVAEMERIIAFHLREKEKGHHLPLAIIDLASDHTVGSTCYLEVSLQERGLEIGWTWLAPSVQRTGINTECKYLLLSYAFEQWGAIRVQLKTHHLNLQSQRAIERLGAVKEGVLRNHKIMPDGSYRHSVYYSIIDSEWPGVKAGLEAKMRRDG
ncbi:MAG TPA: GNAT family protein [Ktedonobacteraceae bacterium]